MSVRTCAACDCELDANPIKVQIGGRTVEVCCDDCAQKLNESQASAKAPPKNVSLILAAAAIGALFFGQASAVRAADAVDLTPREHVFYGDLDLGKPAGVQKLYGRLHHAAMKVCTSYTSSVRRDFERRHSECVAQALSGAVADIGNPALTAHHLAKQLGKTPPLQAGR